MAKKFAILWKELSRVRGIFHAAEITGPFRFRDEKRIISSFQFDQKKTRLQKRNDAAFDDDDDIAERGNANNCAE